MPRRVVLVLRLSVVANAWDFLQVSRSRGLRQRSLIFDGQRRMEDPNDLAPDLVDVVHRIARAIEREQQDYAIGGAIALGYWANPRATVDIDLTVFLPHSEPARCVEFLHRIGCEVSATTAIETITEHGFCRASFDSVRVDVFFQTSEFHDTAKKRAKQVDLEGQPIMVWDAETMCVFKMMFFRMKDVVDVKQILRTQGDRLERQWVRDQLVDIFGRRDPRISQWDEVDEEVSAD
ncbi:MAG: nucleotidyl transferase AbiEii/AbiGii toxin family protein [Pirellulales bacterium]|nr:nucleotidyl transferase AbiEii/AbiGii toxin family protein [Pirellulales bacterium]